MKANKQIFVTFVGPGGLVFRHDYAIAALVGELEFEDVRAVDEIKGREHRSKLSTELVCMFFVFLFVHAPYLSHLLENV